MNLIYTAYIKWDIISYEDNKGLSQIFDDLKKNEQDINIKEEIYIFKEYFNIIIYESQVMIFMRKTIYFYLDYKF